LFLTEFFEIFSGFQKSQNQSVVNAFLCKNMLPTYREVGNQLYFSTKLRFILKFSNKRWGELSEILLQNIEFKHCSP
jgi:hypothetical protein